ncbi:hypothetical protein H4582DRAFT_1816483 [Lactarius indigo]|nr:hypothetical protein H4582DRAFT_1816483 [Lactarius indigo]
MTVNTAIFSRVTLQLGFLGKRELLPLSTSIGRRYLGPLSGVSSLISFPLVPIISPSLLQRFTQVQILFFITILQPMARADPMTTLPNPAVGGSTKREGN